ncbi:hypothetical protein COV16_07095 [Candidatus Woesearchaeota archaeon CG10_big_fil_rev_8_21_14_0_10_34_8]|nr:MAG: hypothetical protein COV16_07095 [Candidatus Woesearchaeota archaeon CG10_big_fil_rev_8_21_14_0_10_34_8]
MANKHVPLILTVIASLTFIFPPTLIKLLIDEISPIGALTVRFFIAALGFPIIISVIHKDKLKSVIYSNQKELAHFAAVAFLLCISMAVLFSSYYFIPANKAMLIFLIYPVFDSIFAWAFLKERIAKITIVAIILSVIGAYFILGVNVEGKSHSIVGYILAILGMLMFAGYLVMSRSVGKHYDYYKRTTWLFIFSFFFLCIVFFFAGGIETIHKLSPVSWLWLIMFGTISTLVPYTLLSYTTAKINASVVSIIVLVGPALAIGLVTLIFNEPFTTSMIIGSVCVLAAFIITTLAEWYEEENIPKKKHKKHWYVHH